MLSANESRRILAVVEPGTARADALSFPLCCSTSLPAVMFTIVLMPVKKFLMQPNYVMPSCLSNPTLPLNFADSYCPPLQAPSQLCSHLTTSILATRAQLLCSHVWRIMHDLSGSFWRITHTPCSTYAT